MWASQPSFSQISHLGCACLETSAPPSAAAEKQMKWKRVQAAVKNKSNTVIWQTAVKRSPFLSRLPKEELKYIKTNARLQALSAGEVIFEEGSEPEYYYIVQDGMVRATQFQGDVIKRARDYGPSDGFGSHEMLYPGMRRTTTCTAVDEVKYNVFELSTCRDLVAAEKFRDLASWKSRMVRVGFRIIVDEANYRCTQPYVSR